MAIAVTGLTSGSNNAAVTTYTTASVTPTANRLQLLAVANAWSGSARTPGAITSVTGNGLTWVYVGSAGVGFSSGSTYLGQISLYRAMGASPTTGAITITLPASGASCAWSLVEVDGVDTTGTSGSGAVVQSASNQNNTTGSTLTVTLGSAFGSASNGTYACFSAGDGGGVARTFTPEAGWTETHDTGVAFSYVTSMWRADNDTTASTTASSTATSLGGIVIEIKAAGTGVSTSVTSVTGTGAVGSVTFGTRVYTTGVSATSALGSVTFGAGIYASGVAATGSVGNEGVTAAASTVLTGVAATGAVGTEGVTAAAGVTVTGVSATSALGAVVASLPGSAAVTAVTGTGAVGTVGFTASGSAAVTAVTGTGAVGTSFVTAAANLNVSGVEANTATGSVTFGVGFAVSGVAATSAVGNEGVTAAATAPVTGVSATGALNNVIFIEPVLVPVTGMSATSALGTTGFRATVNAAVIGSSLFSDVGDVTTRRSGSTVASGVAATGAIGTVAQNTVPISFKAKVGSLTPRSTAGTQAITGLGFTPKVVELWFVEQAVVNGFNQLRYCYGAGDGTSQFVAVVGYDYDIGDSYNQFLTTKALHVVNADDDSTILSASIVSLDADGFTLNFTTGATGKTVYYEAIGGSGVTAKVGTFDSFNAFGGTGTGLQAVTGTGFLPKALQFVAGPKRTDGAAQADVELLIGFATPTASAAMNFYAQELNGTTLSCSGLETGAAIIGSQNTTPASYAYRGRLSSMDANGFTINWEAAPYYGTKIGYIAFAGAAQYKVGSFDSIGSVGQQTISGLGFSPSEATFISQGITPASGYRTEALQCLGVATSPTQVASASFFFEDQFTNLTGAGYPFAQANATRALVTQSATGNGMSVATMDYVSSNPDGFTVNWVNNEGSIKKVGYFVSGFTTLTPAGVQATGNIGTATVSAKASTAVTGVSATSALGTPTYRLLSQTGLTGVAGTGQIGAVSVSGKASVAAVRVDAAGQIGTLAYAGSYTTVNVTTSAATGAIGSVGTISHVRAVVTGVSATSAVGNGSNITGAVFSSVPVLGVEAQGLLNSIPIIFHNCHVPAYPVVATGVVQDKLIVYASQFGIMQALPGQWSSSVGGNTGGWDDVDPPVSGGWKSIPPA